MPDVVKISSLGDAMMIKSEACLENQGALESRICRRLRRSKLQVSSGSLSLKGRLAAAAVLIFTS